ncbi:MAG: AAA family ATPase [Prevotellaceae bacterium]|jgi:predicted ATP-binding protein involved in virulence|nr:AAA family ATPase [Prevotellaceae bacterium]
MRIRRIRLSNYRNFKDYSIDFGDAVTLFIGKNGMGKTNLLSGLKQSLSFIFSKRENEPQFKFLASSNQQVKTFSATDARYGEDDALTFDYIYPVEIKAEASISTEVNLEWSFRKESKASGLNEYYRGANAQFWTYYMSHFEELPVLAFFSDSYPHVKTNIGRSMQAMLKSGNPLPRNTAYYKWDEEKNCTELWMQYFTMQWMNNIFHADAEKKKHVDAIVAKVVEFSQPMSTEYQANPELILKTMNMEKRGNEFVLVLVFENGDRIPFAQLPQGYKRIFSIVFDIANRSYLLNQHCDPSGIVLIDELELHLHPSIAQEILSRYTRAFPHLQFIVSTHSPLVITNFKQNDSNILYKLYKEETEYKSVRIDDLFGVDYNSGLKYSMDTPERDVRIEQLRDAYLYWKDAGDERMIMRLKERLAQAIGTENQLYRSLVE